MQQRYKGLSNIGATCYMNSLLQTLYMTPQFKQAIYQWKYNERIHPKPQDSILYQLQKLFGKLDKKFPAEVTTRDLVKSFQWADQEAQMQQDIQQFNRVLFQALQKSLTNKKQPQQSVSHFVRDLYQGEMIHYTHCKQCQNQSQKQQIFQDLILTVKNPYQKIYNNSAELGIQRYMKPQVLDQDNLYSCENCQKKVQAERGVRFLKMPKLLNIILRRFDFDYFTFQRIKVNDRVQFPHILNMNNYMQGYQNIQNKLNEDSSAYFINKQVPQKHAHVPSTTTTHRKVVAKKQSGPNVAGKITTKPSVNTKSFLAQMRKKKNQQVNQDLFYVSGNAEVHKKDVQTHSAKLQQTTHSEINKKPIAKSTGVSPLVRDSKQPANNLSSQPEEVKVEKQQKNNNEINQKDKNQSALPYILPPPPPLLVEPPKISQPYSNTSINTTTISKEEQLQKILNDRQKKQQEKSQKLEQLKKKNQQLKEKYLKEGPLVYQLYAVLIHNGTATHGHYFSYIRSFQNGHWYSFNDDRVNQINVQDLQKTYGGVGFSNAYALYYRQISNKQSQQQKIQSTIPKYIELMIQQEMIELQRRQKEKIENLENVLSLKIYYQLVVKILQINKSSTLELCLTKARQMFDIAESIPLHNTRLRMFNPISETKLQTFNGQQKMSLEQLKILSFKSLLLQVKRQQEIFEEYVAGKINIRIALWEECKQNLKSLDQAFLTLHKVSINKGAIIKDVQTAIQQKRREVLKLGSQENSSICIVKRHKNDQYSYHQIVNVSEYKQKNIDQLMIMENQILFVQPDSNKLMWPQQFQNQIYKITIKYVNGQNGRIEHYLTDSRKTIGEVKKQLCQILRIQQNQTIIRRGNKSGMELKNLNSTMKDSRFISGTQIYLQKGLPAKPGEVRIQLFIATDAAEDCYNRLHQFQFVADVPINGQCKASQVKQLFCGVLKRYKNLDLKPNQFRIRQKVCDKIGKIYRQRPMKQQQLIQKRQIAIQIKPDNLDGKDFLVYVRIWDPQTWTLSKKYEINVSKTTTMKDLANIIYNQSQQVPIQQMQICRILSLNKFNILDLCEMEYFQITDASVVSQPLFVNTDGLMFIIKSNKKQPRSLTKEQQTKFGGNIKPYVKTTRARVNQTTKKQKGILIKVVQNNQTLFEQIKEVDQTATKQQQKN